MMLYSDDKIWSATDRVYYAGFSPNCKVYRAKRTATRVRSGRYNDSGVYVTEQAKAEQYCKNSRAKRRGGLR